MLTSILACRGAHGSVATSPLTAAIVLPFLGALAVALVPTGRVELHRLVALLFAAGTGAITRLAAGRLRPPRRRLPVRGATATGSPTSGSPGTSASTGSRCSSSCCPACCSRWPSWPSRPHHDPKPYYAWLLVLQGGCIGVFCALDLFVFFVMFEIVLVPMYFLIGGWGYAERVYAALKFFIFTMLGSALMLVGIVSLAFLHHDGVADDNEADAVGPARRRPQLADAAGAGLDPTTASAVDAASPGASSTRTDAQAERAAATRRSTSTSSTIAESQHVNDTSTSANPLDWSARRAGSSSPSPSRSR